MFLRICEPKKLAYLKKAWLNLCVMTFTLEPAAPYAQHLNLMIMRATFAVVELFLTIKPITCPYKM